MKYVYITAAMAIAYLLVTDPAEKYPTSDPTPAHTPTRGEVDE